jgi:hypothetical protein
MKGNLLITLRCEAGHQYEGAQAVNDAANILDNERLIEEWNNYLKGEVPCPRCQGPARPLSIGLSVNNDRRLLLGEAGLVGEHAGQRIKLESLDTAQKWLLQTEPEKIEAGALKKYETASETPSESLEEPSTRLLKNMPSTDDDEAKILNQLLLKEKDFVTSLGKSPETIARAGAVWVAATRLGLIENNAGLAEAWRLVIPETHWQETGTLKDLAGRVVLFSGDGIFDVVAFGVNPVVAILDIGAGEAAELKPRGQETDPDNLSAPSRSLRKMTRAVISQLGDKQHGTSYSVIHADNAGLRLINFNFD